jgi:DNA-binding CsgD family transcriptional regulator
MIETLTPGEKRVFDEIICGYTNEVVASKLRISIKTVKFHLTRIYAKFNVKSRTELLAKYHLQFREFIEAKIASEIPELPTSFFDFCVTK